MNGGTYSLVIEIPRAIDLSIGALGRQELPAGWYAYTGSALGSGGFARVDRHRRVAAGDHDVCHWHVDYLLGHDATAIEDIVRADGRDIECDVAGALPEGPVDGFGASDCDCGSHLAHADSRTALRDRIAAAYDSDA
jgi:endonuclease-3